MTAYSWNISSGGTITAGGTSASNTVTVNWNTAGTQTVSVNYTNGNGCAAATATIYNVTVNPLPVPLLSGPASVCTGAAGNIYSTQAGMNSYSWTLSGGGILTSGGTTNSNTATVSWNAAGPQSVSINYVNTNGCTVGNPSVYPVTVNVLPVPTLSGPAIVCANSTGNVYTTQTGMNGYSWSVSPGGTISSGSGTNVISVNWNVTGAQTVSVNYANANGCFASSPVGYNVSVNPVPVPVISGPTSACAGSTGNVYSSQAGMSGYTWNITAGGVITNGAGTNTITVSWNSPGNANVSVNYTNASGCFAVDPTSFAVVVNPPDVPQITGPSSSCVGSSANIYTTQSGKSNYNWIISAGGIIQSGAGTNSVSVLWNANGNQTISVSYTASTGCSTMVPTVYNVSVNALPVPSVTGSTVLCQYSGSYSYSTEAAMNNYSWNVSAGGTITSGSGTNQVQIDWSMPGTQWVSVTYNTPAGCATAAPGQLNISVNPLPANPGSIYGLSSVCAGTEGLAYSVDPVPNTDNYFWQLPAGASIVSGAGTNSISVNFSDNATSGSITVQGSNSCGNGSPSVPYMVAVNPLPAAAGTIAGTATLCAGSTGLTYTVNPDANATNFVWTIPAGAAIVSGAGTNSISVDFSNAAVSGIITVFGSNSCGNGQTSAGFQVTVNPVPAAAVITSSGDTLLSSNIPTGNQWYLDGNLLPGANGQTLVPLVNGEYSDVITLNGCNSGVSNFIILLHVGIEEQTTEGFSVYPVPNHGYFNVSISSVSRENCTLSVYSSLGSLIFRKEGIEINGRLVVPVDIRPAPEGVYMVELRNGKASLSRKILVVR